MGIWTQKHGSALRLCRGALIAGMLCVLVGADSRVSVYGLWALAGMACLLDNGQHGRTLPLGWQRWLALAGCGIFGLVVCLANYPLFEPLSTSALLNIAVVFLGSGAAVWELLCAMVGCLPLEVSGNRGRLKGWQVYLAAFAVVATVYLVYFFTVAWPGGITNDSLSQLTMIQTGYYYNHHPYWHTQGIRLLFRLGEAVMGGVNGGVAMYCGVQAVFLAGCFAYGVMTLYQAGLPGCWVAGAAAAFAFAPYHFVYASVMWKDIPFAAAVLVFTVAMYRSMKGIGRGNGAVIFLSALCCCVWRTNGLMAMAVAGVLYLLWKDQRRGVTVMLLAVACGWVLVNPVLKSMEIRQPDTVESLSIPVQQVARVLAEGRELTEEEWTLLDRVVDVEEVPSLYEWYISDPIKDEIRSKDNAFFQENIGQYGKLWLRLGLRYPGDYLKAWIDQTKGYWNGGYDYWVFPIARTDNALGISWPEVGRAGTAMQKVVWLFEVTPWLQWMTAIGAHVWLFVLAGLGCLLTKRREGWLTVPVLLVIATLWVATPVSSEFRYAYCLFTTAPFLLPALLGSPRGKTEE